MAGLALILLGVGVVVIVVAGMSLVFTMDTGPDWLQSVLVVAWFLLGWGSLIVGAVLGIIKLFQVALSG